MAKNMTNKLTYQRPYKVRAEVSLKNYQKVKKLSKLQFDVGFDKSLSVLLRQIDNSRGKRK